MTDASTSPPPDPEPAPTPASEPIRLPLIARGIGGGVLMGLANLVPGISGGTMLLAAGIYPRFIEAIAEVTTLRFRPASLAVLASVVGAALVGIVALAGVVKMLVVDHRWIMYSVFIGLTLGGVPVVWQLIGQRTASVWGGFVAGMVGMVLLAWLQHSGTGPTGAEAGMLMLFLAGVAGASAMILPGVSGGYLLLVLGVYVPILSGIEAFKTALGDAALGEVMNVGLRVGLPVAAGVLVGVAVVSNLLGWLLKRYEKATLGVLLGLLVGAVVGLWPFQQTVSVEAGDMVKGQAVVVASTVLTSGEAADDPEEYEATGLAFQATGKAVGREDLPTELFSPSLMQVLGALALIAAGFGITFLVALIGREPTHETTEELEETP